MKRRSNELLATGRSLDNIRPPTVVIRSGVKIIKPINKYCQRHNGPKALSTQLTHSTPFIQSRSFNLVQLQLCFVWLRTRHTQNNFDKSMQQLKQIYVIIMTNPQNNLEKSMYEFSQTHVTNQRNSFINFDKQIQITSQKNPSDNFDKSNNLSKVKQYQKVTE